MFRLRPSGFLSRFIFLLQASISVQVIEKFVSILFFFSGPLKLRVLGSSPLDLRRDCRVLAVGGALSTPRLGPLLYCGASIVMDCIAIYSTISVSKTLCVLYPRPGAGRTSNGKTNKATAPL